MRTFGVVVCSLLLLTIAGCSQMMSQHGGKKSISSSLMSFLYPNESDRNEHVAELPILNLPLRVGVAFVPSSNHYREGISHTNQVSLLEKVKQSFVQYEYIASIEVIPSAYLSTGKGFDTLDQLSRLHNIDVIALVSYDQLSQSYENNAALLYWTIVGMYVIPGNENTVQTFVDTAVFDIASRKMLFRAPGINKLEKRTTAVGIDDALADKSLEGFELAVDDMIVNLDAELSRFKTRVKEEKVAKVTHKQGYSGGGLSPLWLLLISLFAINRRRRLDIHD